MSTLLVRFNKVVLWMGVKFNKKHRKNKRFINVKFVKAPYIKIIYYKLYINNKNKKNKLIFQYTDDIHTYLCKNKYI